MTSRWTFGINTQTGKESIVASVRIPQNQINLYRFCIENIPITLSRNQLFSLPFDVGCGHTQLWIKFNSETIENGSVVNSCNVLT